MKNVMDDSTKCTGCEACVNSCPQNCITMDADAEGFFYPHIGTDCINCGLCKKVCPVIHSESNTSHLTTCYAAKTKNDTIRVASTSGGIFACIAEHFVKNGGVVFGASYDENYNVKHIAIQSFDELPKLYGSKYAQSRIGDSYRQVKQFLSMGKPVLFSGTACQIEGLLAFLRGKKENLYLLDIVCHSVPSPLAWSQYIAYRKRKENQLANPIHINMRSKHTGWSHYQYSVVFEYEDGIQYSKSGTEDIYMKLFVDGLMSRPSCGTCSFKGIERSSDITLGDYWGIWDSCPEMDDNMGTSVVLVHSQQGSELWNAISNFIDAKEMSSNDISNYNQAIFKPLAYNAKRQEIITLACAGHFDECVSLMNKKPTFLQKLSRYLRG